MSEYTPTADEVRDSYADGRVGIGEWTRFDDSVKRAVEEAYAEFDRMIAQVERAAAEKAWGEGHAAGRDYQGDGWNCDAHDPEEGNPYRAAEIRGAAAPVTEEGDGNGV